MSKLNYYLLFFHIILYIYRYGVLCRSGSVEYIAEAGTGLYGTLPSELGLLNQLTFFWVYSNNIYGSVPSELGLLTGMKQGFGLYVNSFTGSIPSELGMMTELTKDFYLVSNGFSGSIPVCTHKLLFV